MKFWRVLRWIATAALTAILIFALLTAPTETPPPSSVPSRPAPTILR